MAKADMVAGAASPCGGLPDEIVVYEILVRRPPKSILRCRAVCRAWRGATTASHFLLAHHVRQPHLPIVCGSEHGGAIHENFFAFDHHAADGQLQPVARLDDSFCPEACCDGLLILSNHTTTGPHYSVCNLVTRQHAPLRQASGFDLLGMYRHRPTREYRLLLQLSLANTLLPEVQVGCYVFTLGSNQPPRYIREPVTETYLRTPVLIRDSMHWFPVHRQSGPQQYHAAGSEVVLVFNTTSESFRQMRDPDDVPGTGMSYVFEMDARLGIYSFDKAMRTVDIWVLQNYESEVWEREYIVKLPVAYIEAHLRWDLDDNWNAIVVSVEGEVLLLVSHCGWMFYINMDGELVDTFHRDDQRIYACEFRLKQTLVRHNFFMALEGYAVNALPFV